MFEATVDTELIGLVARRGPDLSQHLVLTTVAAKLPRDRAVVDVFGAPTDTGHTVLRRWDHIRKEWA
jgi:hypothetical protein